MIIKEFYSRITYYMNKLYYAIVFFLINLKLQIYHSFNCILKHKYWICIIPSNQNHYLINYRFLKRY